MGRAPTPKRKATRASAERKAEVDAEVRFDVSRGFTALRRTLERLGEREAADVLDRIEAAVLDGEEMCPGQSLTHRQVLAELAAIASDTPKTKGRPMTKAARVYPRLVSYVEETRDAGKCDDTTIAIAVAWMWVQAYDDEDARARELIEAKGRLRALAHEDADRFVRNVHRELRYPRTDSLTNAASQRRSRAHKAKKTTRRAA